MWVGIAFAVTVLVAVVVLIIFLVRHSRSTKRLSSGSVSRPEAATSSQNVLYNAGNLYYPTDTPEGLFSAAPPTYASLKAEDQFPAEYPPPSYTDLHPSAPAVQQ